MNRKLPVLAAIVFTFMLSAWLPKASFSQTPISIPTLGRGLSAGDDDPGIDDPNGARVYDFYRQRNPQTGLVPDNILQKERAFGQTLPKIDEAGRSITWQSRGPFNLGGRTRAVAIDITNNNTILAGQVTGGMWRSDNGGASFTQTLQPEQLHSTTCIAQDKRPGHTNTWYYGTGEQYAVVSAASFSCLFAGDGIFKSTDGGHTWNQLPSTATDTAYPNPFYGQQNFDFVWQIVADPSDTVHDNVYAATVNGIWRSTDGGTTWAPTLGLDTSSSLGVSLYSDIAITSTGVLYATISSETPSGGIWRSTDGVNWTNITPAGFPTDFERVEMGIAPSDENQVYFIAQSPNSGVSGHNLWHYHYYSGDGTGTGGVWTNLTANIPDDHCAPFFGIDFKAYNSQDSYDMFLSVYPTDTNIIFLGGTDLYRSTDGFTTKGYDWIGGYVCDTPDVGNYVYPGHHPDQHRLIFMPGNNQIAISSSDGGVRETQNILADTVDWVSLNNGYCTGQFYTCAVEPGNTNSQNIIGGLQDNGTYYTDTSDYTQPWLHVFQGDGGYAAMDHGRQTYYMSFEEGKTFKVQMSDNGTVSNYTRIDPSGGAEYIFISPFMLDPTNDSIMYLAAGTLLWRNDSLPAIPYTQDILNPISQGWHKLTGSLISGGLGTSITAMSMSEASTDTIYYGTSNGYVYRLDSCRTSNSTQKVNITGSNFPAGAYVSSIQVDRLDPSKLLVAFSNYGVVSIFYSSNYGQTWTPVAGNLEENPNGSGYGPSVNWAHMYNNGTATTYYAGTSIGLYSTDSLNGANTVWSQEGPNTIGNVVIDMVTSRAYDSLVVVATHGNGIYTNKVFIPAAVNQIQAGLKFSCYPNPFDNSVTIQAGNTPGNMEADIYDISGRLVRTLKQSNTNKLVWDGATGGSLCAPGTYIIRVTLDGNSGYSKVVKM